MSLPKKLIDSTKIYCEVASVDHHKDRDMHFEIIKQYSYGQEPFWYILHNGYISDMELDVMQEKHKTEADAEAAMLEWLNEQIVFLLESYKSLRDDSDYNVVGARNLVKKYNYLTPPSKA